MRLIQGFLPLAGLLLVAGSSCQRTQTPVSEARPATGSAQVVPEGFTPLFNGANLDGWMAQNPDNQDWRVVEGVIDCDPHEGPGDRNLWTTKSYGDFELLVDWRITESPYRQPGRQD